MGKPKKLVIIFALMLLLLLAELSHRSKEYTALNKETMDLLRSLL